MGANLIAGFLIIGICVGLFCAGVIIQSRGLKIETFTEESESENNNNNEMSTS
jgi:hypothetical protein